MDSMVYVAMTGAKETMLAQAQNAHNLANVSTTGFRADISQARAMPIFGEGFQSRVFAMTERPGYQFQPGPIITTGNELDVAIQREGFLAVQGPDGQEAYTRRGDLKVSANGLLETGGGDLVLGNGGPIAIPPYEKLDIGVDGTITIRPLGAPENEVAVLDRLRLVNPPLDQIHKNEFGLFVQDNGAPAPPDAAVTVQSGAIEGSNVNAVEQLTELISLSRQYEMNIKMMQTEQQNDQAMGQLLRG